MKTLALGLMSGTSADGLGIAAVELSPFKVAAFKTYPYRAGLRREILAARELNARELSRLGMRLGKLYACCVAAFCKEFKIPYSRVEVIGSHGQTAGHWPDDKPAHTLQIGEASFMAELTGAPVVCDFRPRDMAAGGCGAPLIPFFDEFLFGGKAPRILLNIGGIANITAVGRGVRTFGFDTGPGNCLMDLLVSAVSGGRRGFDRAGSLAARAEPDGRLLAAMLRDPYFKKPVPKSLDRDYFGARFLARHHIAAGPETVNRALATLNKFTAVSAARGILAVRGKVRAREVIVSGGGALNDTLLRNLAAALPDMKITRSGVYGLDELAREPACFAVLAHLALRGAVNHCPRATGARGARVLGKIIPAAKLKIRD
ncbi:MAG: anhydro-N-acetylmuramic acid kinase [Elusimicrobiaceae bacterium]|nr:anhydro-N-acetylmuramic acid kinase [Elusimicrobiaceae bacterium]